MRLPLSLSSDARPFDALAIGENSLDLVAVIAETPQPNAKHHLQQFVELPGGEAASAAVGLARLGWRVKYIGRFGDDRHGAVGRESLEAEGVDIRDCTVVAGARSRLAVILVSADTGDRTVLWDRDRRLELEPGDISSADLASARVLLVGSDDVEAMTWAAREGRRVGMRTVGDLEHIHPGTAGLLGELDVIVMAESFPARFTGESDMTRALARIAESTGAALLCVTLGPRGCVASIGGQTFHVPAAPVEPVDTTGAGDLFRAGLIARWLMEPEGPEVEPLLRYANTVAGLGCRALGARTAAPRRTEVEALLGA